MSRSTVTSWLFSKTPGVDMNNLNVTPRANQFATKSAGFDSTVLLLRREGNTMLGSLLTTGAGGDSMRAATDLAHTVGARATESEPPEGLADGNVVGWLAYESGSTVARDPQVNVDPKETARLLANTLSDGEWVAVSLRKPSKKERARNKRWLEQRLSATVPNHHSMSPDAVVATVFAGGPDADAVRSNLEATRSAMPGFDVVTRSRVATRPSTVWAGVVPAVACLTLLAAVILAPTLPGGLSTKLTTILGGLAGLGFAVAALRFAGLFPSGWKRTQSMAQSARFAAPRKRAGRPSPPRSASKDQKGRDVGAREGDYPLHASAFLVGPQVVVGVVAPHAGAASGDTSTRVRSVPPVVLDHIGPIVGDTEDQGAAHLPATDAFGGVALVGKAGSGKSVAVRSLFGWSSMERMRPSGLPGFPGSRNALVAFESKGDGVARYQEWIRSTGDVGIVVDIADPESFGIDLFAVPGTVFDQAAFFVNALRYAFGDGAIGDRSFETLLSLMPPALLVTPEVAANVADLPANQSAVYYCHVLLGGRGEEVAKSLAAELAAEAMRPNSDPLLREAIIGMGSVFGPQVTPAQRRGLQEAPRNKMRQLIELESWWSPARRKITWQQVLDGHRVVVVNTGTSAKGHMIEDALNQQISSVLMFSLRHAIQRICSGWQDQDRHVSIFADELSLLAGSSEEIVAWFKDQGRSFGVRPVLATQRPEQLPDRLRNAFMNFSTLISFAQEDMKTAREIADGVSGEEGEWSATDVLNLDAYQAVVRTHARMRRQPAFTVKVRNFEADRAQAAIDQGYENVSVVAPSFTTSSVAESDHLHEPGPVLADPVQMRDLPPLTSYDDSSTVDLMDY